MFGGWGKEVKMTIINARLICDAGGGGGGGRKERKGGVEEDSTERVEYRGKVYGGKRGMKGEGKGRKRRRRRRSEEPVDLYATITTPHHTTHHTTPQGCESQLGDREHEPGNPIRYGGGG